MGEDLKYKIGDIVYSKTWQRNVIIQEIIPGGFYKVGDIHGLGWFTEHEDNLCKVKPKCEIDSAVLEKVNTLKTQSDNMETETHRGYYTTDVETTNESKKVAWFTFEDNDFADKVELDLSNRELIQEDGKWFVVKKKKEYPKTFLGCCDILGIEDLISRGVNGYRSELLDAFQKLLICRDAYWKLYGKEMGLGKPWEPDWNDTSIKYCIERDFDVIIKNVSNHKGYTFAFPTEEMRDAFFNAFREDIEKCKELL